MSEILKARYWWAVMYPENMVDNWQNLISSLVQYPFAYCVHDKDLRKEVKEERKVHIHLIIAFPNTTTYNHALSVFSRLNASGKNAIPNNRFEACVNVSHCYDYLIHNTEDCRSKGKHLYDKSERVLGNSFDIGLFEQLSIQEKMQLVSELARLIRSNDFYNFEDFCEFVEDHYIDDPIYIHLLGQYSAYFERRCKACYYRYLERKRG